MKNIPTTERNEKLKEKKIKRKEFMKIFFFLNGSDLDNLMSELGPSIPSRCSHYCFFVCFPGINYADEDHLIIYT